MNSTIFKTTKYVTNGLFIKKALELKLTLEEFLVLTYFDNNQNYFDIELLSKNLGLDSSAAYQTFNSLLSKKLLNIETIKDIEGRMIEVVKLDNFYNLIMDSKITEQKVETKNDIYSLFENEFGRPITSTEYEIINAWLEKGYTGDLIKGALKEAVYNGVKNFRYIDKILYEWQKKGFKNLDDVNKHLENRNEEKTPRKELFNYNWLDDEE